MNTYFTMLLTRILPVLVFILGVVFVQPYFIGKECSISGQEALKELKRFKYLVNEKSSYFQINSQRFDSAFLQLESYLRDIDKIHKKDISLKVSNVLGELGDRHSRVSYIGDCEDNKFYLPFATAPWKGKDVIALKNNKAGSGYSYFLNDFPLLKSINNINVHDYVYKHNPRDKYAPDYPRFTRGVNQLYHFYRISPHLSHKDTLKFTFTTWDSTIDTTIYMPLSTSNRKWRDICDITIDVSKKQPRDSMATIFQNTIGYIKIPKMYSRRRNGEYFDWLSQAMKKVKDCNALILDIRNNSGGTRDILLFFANYLLQRNNCWVANLARFRGDLTRSAKSGLELRGLRSYENHSENAQLAISQFMGSFSPLDNLNDDKFGDYVYMVLENIGEADTYHFSKPIYILINERSFSAASVFAASLKGFPNVSLCGVTADGASGMSETYRLPKTELELKMSRMVSFQRNGFLFDGHGVSPDLRIERTIGQILGQEDYQLKKILDTINTL